MISSMQCFIKQCQRDCLIHLRQPRLIINTSLFFIMIIIFFPLTIPVHSIMTAKVVPGLIWIAILLSMLLASERFFQQDYEDGILEQWLVSGCSLSLLISAKMLAHWLLIMLPLGILLPFLAVLLFGLSWYEIGILLASFLVGTPTILSLCTFTAAFSVSTAQKGMLMAFISLPLVVPVMIFGSDVLSAAVNGNPVLGQLALLLAMSIIAVSFLPFAIAGIIRIILTN